MRRYSVEEVVDVVDVVGGAVTSAAVFACTSPQNRSASPAGSPLHAAPTSGDGDEGASRRTHRGSLARHLPDTPAPLVSDSATGRRRTPAGSPVPQKWYLVPAWSRCSDESTAATAIPHTGSVVAVADDRGNRRPPAGPRGAAGGRRCRRGSTGRPPPAVRAPMSRPAGVTTWPARSRVDGEARRRPRRRASGWRRGRRTRHRARSAAASGVASSRPCEATTTAVASSGTSSPAIMLVAERPARPRPAPWRSGCRRRRRRAAPAAAARGRSPASRR